MARDPANRRIIYSDKDFPGCMGSIMHLFDFNQALAGRRLLTDKKCGEGGLEAPRNTSEAGNGTARGSKSSANKTDETLFGYDIQKNPSSRKSNGMPIKTLIAQELSKDSEPRNRAPNVVARLMGLDALPADSSTAQQSRNAVTMEKHVLKSQPEERQEQKPHHSTKLYPKRVKSSTVEPLHTSAVLRNFQPYSADVETEKSDVEALKFRNHPQEKQLQEFKKDFEAWQSQKSREHLKSVRLEELDLQVGSKQTLAWEKLNKTKLGAHEKLAGGAKHIAPQEKLHESKEFQDAMDFLQSNRDFFSRFLEEPNSLFARHLQDYQSDFRPSFETTAGLQHKWSHSTLDSFNSSKEETRPDLHGKELTKSRKNHKNALHSERRSGTELLSERSVARSAISPSHAPEVSRLVQTQELRFSPTSNDNRMTGADCQVPTRIVVLKPNTGRNRNSKSSTQNYSPRSPTSSRDAKEVIRDDEQDVLQELRQRLRKGTREGEKEGRRHARQSAHEHYRDGPRGPREIAREIARQVRESVARDLGIDSRRVRAVHSTPNGLTTGWRAPPVIPATDPADVAVSSEGETSTPSKRLSREHQNKSSASLIISPRNKYFDLQAVPGSNEERKRVTEKARMLHMEQADEQHLPEQKMVMRKFGYLEDGRQTSPRSRSSQGFKHPSKGSLGSLKENQVHQQFPLNTDAIKSEALLKVDTDGDLDSHMSYPPLRNGEETKESSPRTLLRSRSVPMASTAAERSQVDLQQKKAGLYEAGAEKAVRLSSNELNRIRSDAAPRAPFNRNASSLKGSFSLGRKRAIMKELPDQVSLPDERSAGLYQQEDACNCIQETRYSMADSGIHVKWDSERYPSESCAAPEDTPDVEDSVAVDCQNLQKFEGSFEHANICTELPEATSLDNQVLLLDFKNQDAEITSPLASPDNLSCGIPASPPRLSALANEMPTSFKDIGKEKFEQPSPVSVLDSPFQEENASPMDFKDIGSELRELRLRLRLLKFDDQEMLGPDLETMQEADGLVIQDGLSNDTDNCSQTASDFDAAVASIFLRSDLEHFDLEKNGIDELSCPKGREEDMLYVKNTLMASGFTGNSTIIVTNWYSPSRPLDPCLFLKIEDRYCSQESDKEERNQINGTKWIQKGKRKLDIIGRRLLFDCLNEVLLEMLGPYLNRRPWVKPYKVSVRCMPTGKELVKCIWMQVCQLSCPQSESQDSLAKLVTKDLAKVGPWLDLTEDMETVGLEIERAIFNDLIEETIIGLVA